MRQTVLAARDFDDVTARLSERLGLKDPHCDPPTADPGAGQFGLLNAVFTLGDTFLEVVSPIWDGTAAGRLMDRWGGDCGYMLCIEVDDLDAARARAREQGVREVWSVSLQDIAEVHLHPADMRGSIVGLTCPRPQGSWRWGGPDWTARSAPGRVTAVTIGVSDPDAVAARWAAVLGVPPSAAGVHFVRDERDRGLTDVVVDRDGGGAPFEAGGVRFTFA